MKYIFFLGRIGELSFAEIHAMFLKYRIPYKISHLSNKILIADAENAINAPDMLVQMGGTIKISEYLGEFDDFEASIVSIRSVIDALFETRAAKKNIGYNIYFNASAEKDKVRAITDRINDHFSGLKKELGKESSMRIVYPDRTGEISSVSIIKNKLLAKGVLFDLIFLPDRVILSKISAIQDIESYSQRDYNRPNRDAKVGMTPPKLAQIMINLAGLKDGDTVYDPFCGVGTIMQEALLNDYRAIGSDANSAQVENCKKNLGWISKKYVLKYPDYKIFQSDSAHAYKKLRENSVNAIITETTLGPIYNKAPNNQEMNQNFRQIEKIYLRFFQNSKMILRNKARIVFTVPAYQIKPDKYVLAPFIDNIEKIGYSIVSLADKKLFSASTRITDRNTIIYSRPDQIVAREIIMFEKK
ncbi:MAG: DNA methyltransferase [Candidatus Paceibacterota bacterium]|jgi:tRNA G10  N-methylase Trm11